MKILNKNTLLDISRHSNKTLKLVEFMSKSDYQLFYKQLAGVSSATDSVLALEAFHKDLTSTVSSLADAHKLLSTVDNDGDVIKLKGDEKNLKNVFGDLYNHDSCSIQLNSINLSLKTEFDPELFKALLIRETLGISIIDYEKLYKERKKILSLQENQLDNDFDKIKYLSTIKSYKKYEEILSKIYDMADSFNDYRSNLPLELKNIIDRDITFERSMIDSVLSTSSLITRDGIEQMASPHKKEKEKINIIYKMIQKHPYIQAVEIDKDVSLDSMILTIRETINTNFNMSSDTFLKARKLGNYNARGLYRDSDKIVAIDVSEPNALIHEFVHAVEFSSRDIMYSPQRMQMKNDLLDRLDKDLLTETYGAKFTSYLTKDVEVIARGGEIAYLLNQHDYKPEEPFETFYERVKAYEKKIEKDVDSHCFVKPIDYYLKNKDKYFDFEKASPELLSDMKEFYQTFFSHDGREIKPLEVLNIEIKKKRKSKTLTEEERKNSRYIPKSVSLIKGESIKDSLKYNDEKKIIDPAIIIREMIENATHIDRSSQKYTTTNFTNQVVAFKTLKEYLDEKNDPRLNCEVIKSVHKVLKRFKIKNIDYSSTIMHSAMVQDNIKIDKTDLLEKNMPKIQDLEKRIQETQSELDGLEGYNWDLNSKLRDLQDDKKKIFQSIGLEGQEAINNAIPELTTRYSEEREFRFHSLKSNKRTVLARDENGDYIVDKNGIYERTSERYYTTSTITERDQKNILSSMTDLCKEILNSDKLEETLSYLKPEDNLSFALLSDPAILDFIENDNIEKFNEVANAILLSNGFVEKCLESKDCYINILSYKYDTRSLEPDSVNILDILANVTNAEKLVNGEMSLEQAISASIDLRELVSNAIKNEKNAEHEYSYITKSKTTGIIQRAANINDDINNDPIVEVIKKKNKKTEANKPQEPKGDLNKQMSLF